MNVIIVHGCPVGNESRSAEKRTYDKHWIPWIREQLEKKGIKVETPLMPEPWEPVYKDWKKEFDKLNIDENSILIGHSGGTTFLVKWIGDTKKKIKKLILVAPWKIPWKRSKENKEFCNYEIDENIKSLIKELIIFTSNDEEEDGKKSAKIFHDAIGGEIIELKNHGHYCLRDMGTNEFPELLEKILE